MRVARCDYCGTMFPIQRATIYWAHAYDLENGDEMCTTGIYCGEPCGEYATARGGASRG